MIGCDEKLTWRIEEVIFTGVCPVHGAVCGILRDRPLDFIEKIVLRIRGVRFKEK